jgi:hypothetical protein
MPQAFRSRAELRISPDPDKGLHNVKAVQGGMWFQDVSSGIKWHCPKMSLFFQHTLNQTTKGDAVTIVTHREIKSSCRK